MPKIESLEDGVAADHLSYRVCILYRGAEPDSIVDCNLLKISRP